MLFNISGSARNMLGFRGSARKSSLRSSEIHSAWQPPVCPTVWPKNVRLAPIDTSRLPSSKNRCVGNLLKIQSKKKSVFSTFNTFSTNVVYV